MNRLTEREQQVLACLCKGMGYKEAAFALGIASNTISQHVYTMKLKTGIKTIAQAAAEYVNAFGMPARVIGIVLKGHDTDGFLPFGIPFFLF